MRKLEFSVEGQTLNKKESFSNLIAGTKGYLYCHFNVNDRDWKLAKKAALFNEKYAVAIDETQGCMVPDEVTDGKSIKMRLIGQNGSTRITTNAVLIEQVK